MLNLLNFSSKVRCESSGRTMTALLCVDRVGWIDVIENNHLHVNK
jgi:hypothetical protein